MRDLDETYTYEVDGEEYEYDNWVEAGVLVNATESVGTHRLFDEDGKKHMICYCVKPEEGPFHTRQIP